LDKVSNSPSGILQDIDDPGLPDAPRFLPRNDTHAYETSLLDESGISALISSAFYRRSVERGATALLIALIKKRPTSRLQSQYQAANPAFRRLSRRHRLRGGGRPIFCN